MQVTKSFHFKHHQQFYRESCKTIVMGLVIVAFDLGDANMQSGSLLWLTEALNHTHSLSV